MTIEELQIQESSVKKKGRRYAGDPRLKEEISLGYADRFGRFYALTVVHTQQTRGLKPKSKVELRNMEQSPHLRRTSRVGKWESRERS